MTDPKAIDISPEAVGRSMNDDFDHRVFLRYSSNRLYIEADVQSLSDLTRLQEMLTTCLSLFSAPNGEGDGR